MQEEKIGSPYKNVVLETASKVYIKTGSRYYEVKYKDEKKTTEIKAGDVEEIANKIADEKIGQIEKPDLSSYVTLDQLDTATSNLVTKRDFESVKTTQSMLANVLRSEFSEAIKPITVQTMQLTVGSDQLQFDWIKSFDDGTVVNGPFKIDFDNNKLTFVPGYVKHYSLCAPEKVQPEIPIQNYFRWYILNPDETEEEYEISASNTKYYAYLQVPYSSSLNGVDLNSFVSETKNTTEHKGNFYIENETVKNDGIVGFYTKTGVGRLVLSPNELNNYEEIDENTGIYNLLYAMISWDSLYPEVTTLNGFTEITPGQIRAYIFSTPDGKSFLDLKNSELKLGDQLHFKNGTLHLQGGVLAGLIGARDANNNIVAGINGADGITIDGDTISLKDDTHGKLMVFAGAENNDLNNSKTKIYEDGMLYTKSADIEGDIKATSGQIGEFSIKGGRLNSDTTLLQWTDTDGNSHTETGGSILSSVYLAVANTDAKLWEGNCTIQAYPIPSTGMITHSLIKGTLTCKKEVDEQYAQQRVGSCLELEMSGIKNNFAIRALDGMYAGFRPKTVVLTGPKQLGLEETGWLGSNTLDDITNVIIVDSEQNLTINLPAEPKNGQWYRFIQARAGHKLIIQGSGKKIYPISVSGSSEDGGIEIVGKSEINLHWSGEKWYATFNIWPD